MKLPLEITKIPKKGLVKYVKPSAEKPYVLARQGYVNSGRRVFY